MTPAPGEARGRADRVLAPNWLVASHAYGLVAALVMGYFLLRIPIQIHDCFTDMCALLQPMGRLVSADEVAHAIAYLASPLSSSTTGTLLAVDGGMAGLRLPS